MLVPSLAEARANQVLARAPLGVVDRILPPGFSDSDVSTNPDVASFRPSNPATLHSTIAIIAKRPSDVLSDPSVDMPVQKVGASSELTMGEVRFVHKVFWLSYPTPRDALFVRHVELLPAQGKHRDLAGFLGMPGRGEDRASSLGEMSREGQADPAVGAGDERLDWVSLRRHGVRWGGRNFRTFHDLLLRG